VSGFEDCRLFWHRGAWWVSATVRDRGARGICQIALLRLENATAVEQHLLSDGASRHEKNWMPAPDAGDDILRFIYTSYPTVITRYDDDAGAAVPEMIQPGPLIARRFSGGSQAIPLDGGRLCLVHEAVNFDDGGRVYTHRWVWFDAAWRLAKLSAPFLLHERGIEFAGGLARRGDDLVISYGVWDREAWLATVPLTEIVPLLTPPLDPNQVEREMRDAAAVIAPTVEIPVAAVGAMPASASPASILDAEFVPIVDEAPWADGITPFPTARATIVSTTLTGNSREIIGDALRSVVEWVDWVLVIDTGVTDDTLEIAREIAGAKLIVHAFPWHDDFAAARNFALEAAAAAGADWAVTLDTDERIDPGAVDVRAALARAEGDALHVKHVNGTYGKERFFRLPARGHYVGPTHEAFIKQNGGSATLEGVHFDELGKSPAQYRQKAERDIAILTRHTAAHPDDPRWFYYLGDSLAGLGRHDEAIAAFRVCASLNGWDEEGAWAMYRAAESLLKLDRPVEAIEACAIGMSRHAGLGELPWLAGYAAWQAGRPAQAAHWARLSILLGHFMGNGPQVPRIGFRHPPALWEGPFDVLRYALRALGDDAGADEAERVFEQAKAAREAG
ncbi:MAG: glycosyltransferase, partial [Thermomicrobiales bacterium]